MKPRVLHLPKWYPHRYDNQDGDFVARQVAAVAPHVTGAVLFAAVAREPLAGLTTSEIDWTSATPTLRYYYRAQITGLAPFDKLLKLALYFWCLGQGYRQIVQHWGGPPQLVHVHVLLRTGLFAWWLRLTRKIPYIVTEHWTLYLPERAHLITWLRKSLTKAVIRQAAALHTVSGALQKAMNRLGFVSSRQAVIANVVDTTLFMPASIPRVPGQLLIVSSFHDAVKNISGILRVVAGMRQQFPHVHLRIAGYGPDEASLRHVAQELGLLSCGAVVFLGKLSQPEVAQEMQQATALVSFSRAETFGCVLLEARAAGCPVVGPATGGVPELFEPVNSFGLLVSPDDMAGLTQALSAVVSGAITFDAERLTADAAARCSYHKVGGQFADLYREILGAPTSGFGRSTAS
ncbi:glycosyltransferase [Hymenobacter taeanensis]|uniref:Glycosyltransferase n=1 Tax=Hymenobacter taeanensis TaxID=2735321 RepID=A0A6M6BGD1_9BACT|nr:MULTISPECIES: glycosyltransferase [Hymenobacter]QJX46293.1 glycosyltransferase [Hymenobacter taeanensis]UOQ80150.1 glycosyltransferase [Hymenobacter sp. 5414T-23]